MTAHNHHNSPVHGRHVSLFEGGQQSWDSAHGLQWGLEPDTATYNCNVTITPSVWVKLWSCDDYINTKPGWTSQPVQQRCLSANPVSLHLCSIKSQLRDRHIKKTLLPEGKVWQSLGVIPALSFTAHRNIFFFVILTSCHISFRLLWFSSLWPAHESLHKLQFVQKAAARIASGLRSTERMKSVLKQLR